MYLYVENVSITFTVALLIFYITPIVDFTHRCDNKIIAKEKMPEKDAKKLKSILGNPELIKKMMKSAQAQELKKSMKNQ